MIEKEFKDRISRNPGEVELTPVAGATNRYKLVRADDPSEVGTPLNKATFDSIIHSRLTGRYYELSSYTKNLIASATVTTNPIPQSGWVNVTYTAAQAAGYDVTASGSLSNSYTPEKAFDGNSQTCWQDNDNVTGETWIAINFGTPLIVTALRCFWTSKNGDGFVAKLQGSNNGMEWTEIATRNGAMAGAEDWSFANPNQYTQYRLHFSRGSSVDVSLYEWAITGWSVGVYVNAFSLGDEVPAVWDVGQRLMVSTTSSLNTVGIARNTLNGFSVRTILQPSKRYELIYDGAAFVVKEV